MASEIGLRGGKGSAVVLVSWKPPGWFIKKSTLGLRGTNVVLAEGLANPHLPTQNVLC